MKIAFYFDVWPWTRSSDDIWPTTKPGEKPVNATRYMVEVEIPDPRNPDITLSAEPIAV